MTNQTLHLQEWVNKNKFTPKSFSHNKIHNFIMKEFPNYDYVKDFSYTGRELNVEREETIHIGEEEYYVTLSELEDKKYIITSYNRYLRK